MRHSLSQKAEQILPSITFPPLQLLPRLEATFLIGKAQLCHNPTFRSEAGKAPLMTLNDEHPKVRILED